LSIFKAVLAMISLVSIVHKIKQFLVNAWFLAYLCASRLVQGVPISHISISLALMLISITE
jgi:hypothetical protein